MKITPRFGAIVQLLHSPCLCVGAATHSGDSGYSPVRPSVGGSRARGPLPEQRCEKETAAGKEADAQPRRLVTVIAIPPSKANTTTTAMVDRPTLEVPRKRLDRVFFFVLGQGARRQSSAKS